MKFLVTEAQPAWVRYFHEVEADTAEEAIETVKEDIDRGGHALVGHEIGEFIEMDCEYDATPQDEDAHVMGKSIGDDETIDDYAKRRMSEFRGEKGTPGVIKAHVEANPPQENESLEAYLERLGLPVKKVAPKVIILLEDGNVTAVKSDIEHLEVSVADRDFATDYGRDGDEKRTFDEIHAEYEALPHQVY